MIVVADLEFSLISLLFTFISKLVLATKAGNTDAGFALVSDWIIDMRFIFRKRGGYYIHCVFTPFIQYYLFLQNIINCMYF